jgi:S-adenosylmethionine synthetase
MHIQIECSDLDPARRELEIVERKGLGHPDTLCDRAAEAFSRRLSRFYLERAGRTVHHNVDKALLVAGQTRVKYGGGEWLSPIAFHLAGRATTSWNGVPVPVEEIARAAMDDAIRPIRHLQPEHVEVQTAIRPGASELRSLFDREGVPTPLANDTSIGVGFAPFTRSETVAIALEHRLNSAAIQSRFPAIGEDIKVMVVRTSNHLRVTVAAATIARFVPDSVAYCRTIDAVREISNRVIRQAGFQEFEIAVNAADEIGQSEYLTLSGTSAEAGDDGQVGRGN